MRTHKVLDQRSGGARLWAIRSADRRFVTGALAVLMAAVSVVVVPFIAAGQSFGETVLRTVASDQLNRTVAAGWGRADVGGSYTHSDQSIYSADGNSGVIKLTPGRGGDALLNGVNLPDGEAQFTFSVSSIPQGGSGIYVGAVLRQANGRAYLGVVRIAPGGAAKLAVKRQNNAQGSADIIGSEVNLPLVVSAGQAYTLRFHVSGQSSVRLAARVSPSGSSGTTWQVDNVDSSAQRVTGQGSAGIWSYLSGSSAASTVDVDNVLVESIETSTTPSTTSATTTTTPTKPPATTTATTKPAATTTTSTTTTSSTTTAPAAQTGSIGTSGSVPVGSASYAVPSGAVFVSTSGSDSAVGSVSAPLRTVQAAVNKAPAGATVVVRGGTYHETVSVVSRTVTIQNYPGEAVWFDGSSVVSKWSSVRSGVWAADNWTAQFDASASYTFGGSDGNTAAWTFINPSYPMASHPDQVWVNGSALQQVRSQAEVGPGKFAVDYSQKRLYIGSDPGGREVRASDLATAMQIRTQNSVVRGVGFRRYAPSIPHIGAVTIEQSGAKVENVVLTDNATTALGLISSNITVNRVTVMRNGLLGIHVATADNLKLLNVLSSQNNTEHFNTAPVSGGIKVGRSRGVTVDHGQFENNEGPGLWLDVSVYNTTITNSVVRNNANHGLFLEISARVTVANNVISGNRENGIKLNNTSEVSIWNNTMVDNGRPIWIAQDSRRGNNPNDYGHDYRQPFPDPTMTWIIGPAVVRNNVFSGATSSNCFVCVEDYSRQYTAEQLRVSLQGNVYQRDTTSKPSTVIVWARGSANPATFSSLAAFTASTGQESRGLALDGVEAVGADGTITSRVSSVQSSVAEPLASEIAALIGQPAGTKRLGAFL